MSNGRSFRRPIRPATDRRLVVGAEIPDSASPAVKERAARRRLVAVTGRCPCGAVLRMPEQLAPGVVNIIAVDHQDGCPAIESAP
jgi:hypothetical protein